MKISNQLKQQLKQQANLALVTGASSGIGKAIVNQLAQAGVDLIITSRSEDTLNRMAAELRGTYKIEVEVLAFDLSKKPEVLDFLAATEEKDIDTLIHCAGYGTSGEFIENDKDAELNMASLNMTSTLLLSYEFGNRFVAAGKGNIVLISSILGFQGAPLSANYAASKAYVQSFGEALAKELKPKNVNILVASPGPTNTGFADRAAMTMDKTASPDEVATDILKKLGKSGTVIPSKLAKLLHYSMAILPRSTKVNIMNSLMQKMAKQSS